MYLKLRNYKNVSDLQAHSFSLRALVVLGVLLQTQVVVFSYYESIS